MNTKIVVSSLCGAAALAPAVAAAAAPAAPAAGTDPASAPEPVTGVTNAVAQVLSTDAAQKVGTAMKHADQKRAAVRARAAAAPNTNSTGPGAAAGGAASPTLQAIAQCESSGDPSARSGPYGGLYQFDAQTWASVGGTGDPASASPQEQTMRAEMLMQREGMTPWPVCGAGK